MSPKIEIELTSGLDALDRFFKKESKNLKNHIEGQLLPTNSIFKCEKELVVDKNTQISELPKKYGIYVFVVEKDFKIENPTQFNKVNNASKIKKSKTENPEYTKDTIFYLGKSEDNIRKRIEEHLTLDGESSTYSLKLNDKDRKFLLESKLKLYIFTLDQNYDSHKKLILTSVESYLHETLDPIVGSAKNT